MPRLEGCTQVRSSKDPGFQYGSDDSDRKLSGREVTDPFSWHKATRLPFHTAGSLKLPGTCFWKTASGSYSVATSLMKARLVSP